MRIEVAVRRVGELRSGPIEGSAATKVLLVVSGVGALVVTFENIRHSSVIVATDKSECRGIERFVVVDVGIPIRLKVFMSSEAIVEEDTTRAQQRVDECQQVFP